MQDINFDTIIPILESNDVEFAGVFGSFAKGKASEKSDIDLLVKFTKPKSLMKIIRLERMLSEKLDKKIDLVTDKALSPYIKEIILNDLRLIYGAR
ncbi:MAG: polymerase, beta domain protein region protein [Parcubacteria group bacterium GW2011_GWB1_41_6]|nr:MAG: polymerase, beta domain protein region protein [Parcubacteria group bacterium GW2011_GWB1_41_6]